MSIQIRIRIQHFRSIGPDPNLDPGFFATKMKEKILLKKITNCCKDLDKGLLSLVETIRPSAKW
jgi:hypothetical protein